MYNTIIEMLFLLPMAKTKVGSIEETYSFFQVGAKLFMLNFKSTFHFKQINGDEIW